MQYTQLAVLALALGANARTQRRQYGSGDSNPWAQWSQPKGVSSESSNSTGSEPSSASSASSAPLTTASATLYSDVSSGGSIPASSGTSALSAVQTIAAGESFDGGMFVYDRGQSCTGQSEGGDSDAVFILEVSTNLQVVPHGSSD
jgi:hypothetical protein